MDNNIEHIQLVRLALQGDEKCRKKLAIIAEKRLREDVYRLTLNHYCPVV